jgi:Ca2+-binding RTX toxin-like protein
VGLDASGRILVGAGYSAGLPERLFAVRFVPGGVLDNSFGGDGAGEAVIGSPFFNGGMAVDNSDRPIVSGGFDNTVDPPVGTFALARFQAAEPESQAAALCLGKVPDIVGTEGKDAIQGTSGPDVIDAGAGNDKVTGFAGKDRICGGPGKDRLFGGPGKDRIQGGRGNDVLRGGKGKDRLKGGKGKDDVRQ